MIDMRSILNAIKTRVYTGSYREVIKFIDALPIKFQKQPAVVLERSRAFLRQGDPINAEAALAKANLELATPGQRLILAMEAAYLRIYRYVAIQEAISAANTSFKKTENTFIDPAEKAEAERILASTKEQIAKQEKTVK
jgi:hypothetical protein